VSSATASASCETVYGFVAGLYPTDYPTRPEPYEDTGTASQQDPAR
jgi:hypothetical protein